MGQQESEMAYIQHVVEGEGQQEGKGQGVFTVERRNWDCMGYG